MGVPEGAAVAVGAGVAFPDVVAGAVVGACVVVAPAIRKQERNVLIPRLTEE